MAARPGGVLLLAQMIEEALSSVRVAAPVLPKPIEDIKPKEVLHSILMLDEFAYSVQEKDADNSVYRIRKMGGFNGPANGAIRPLAVSDYDAQADIIVLDDVGNGFRDDRSVWPQALKEGKNPNVVLKMSRPLAQGKLWDLVQKHAERLVVVVSADDLRSEGINISRQLSWERTAKDFVWQMNHCKMKHISSLAKCSHLIVRFGLDGVIHYQNSDGKKEAQLYYDPLQVEGGFNEQYPGEMVGLNSAFVAALTASVAQEGLNGIGEGIHKGILTSRQCLQYGFGKKIKQFEPEYPVSRIFSSSDKQPKIAQITIPQDMDDDAADSGFWTILGELMKISIEDVVYEIVNTGTHPKLEDVPVGAFGKLKTLDREEIESFRSIQNLMVEYLKKDGQKQPLSIAVFGPPGSGKSFAVIQIAKSIAPGSIRALDFNLSQWDSPLSLIRALHQVRDVVLGGKLPLVFFDEFDARLHGESLGWLKYFLEPMHSGTFRDGEIVHPIGKAIFVFAGGISKKCSEFIKDEEDQEFRNAKGRDFVSRLRGYMDIIGLNPTSEKDDFYLIRRAILLRPFLFDKARHLFEEEKMEGVLRIDPNVLRALLKVPEYKHGVRSMDAVLEMSMLAGRHSFEQSALPPKSQLNLHVDAEIFYRLVVRDVLLGSAREGIAQVIHERFRLDQKDKKKADDPAMQPWDKLEEGLKESNRQQADHIPVKLNAVGYGFVPIVGRKAKPATFTKDEIEKMAELEHERWVEEREAEGWKIGPRNPDKKISPHLIGWDELEDDIKEYDRNAVRAIPELMAEAGFELYRMKR